MDSKSCKAKGRRLQQLVRDALLATFKYKGLEAGDIVSTGMGQSGVDVVLSPAAIKVVGNLAVECKSVEKLSVVTVFWEHYNKYIKNGFLPLLVHKRNHTKPLVTLTLDDFLRIYHDAKCK